MGKNRKAGRWGRAAYCLRAWVHARRLGYRLARRFDSDAKWSRRREPCRGLARIAWRAPEGSRASSIALGALRKAAANPLVLREILATFCWTAEGDPLNRPLRSVAPPPTPSPVTEFMLEPVEDGVPRVIAFLDAPQLPLPGPGGGHDELARWLVHAALAEETASPRADFGPLSDLLARTEQPELLDALHSAFSAGVKDMADNEFRRVEFGRVRAYRLWKSTGPSLLTRILLANPHLLRLPPPEDGPPWRVEADRVLLVLLKGRPDLVDQVVRVRGPQGIAASLREGITMEGPPELMRACKKALRSLEHPVVRDDVCRSALTGDREMRAAAIDAGYFPSDSDEAEVAAFLFATGQWERYDAADPDGSLLKTFCTRRHENRLWWDAYRAGFDWAALISRRPKPVLLPLRPRRSSSGRGGGATGYWLSSLSDSSDHDADGHDSGGHDGGGHDGGGHDGGGGYDGGGHDGGGYDGGGGHGGGYDGGGGHGSGIGGFSF